MGTEIAPIGAPGADVVARQAPRDPRPAAASVAEDTVTLSHGEIPASPPPEVLDAIDAAGRVARELHETGRELRFTPTSEGAAGHVRVDVCDLDGNVLRTIPPSELLDVASGAPLD